MEKSTYPEGCEVHQDDLAYTETTKAYHILRRFLDSARMGIVSGCRVTRNGADHTKVDISAGTVYVPSGEYVAVLSTQAALSLSDASAGVINYVCLTYTESATDPVAHESLGVTRTTKTVATFVPHVYTAAQLSTLTADERAATLVCGTVPGAGIGSALDPSAIVQQAELGVQLTATLVDGGTPITGVNLVALESTMPAPSDDTASTPTVGTLRLIVTDPSTMTLAWKAPTEGAFGAAWPSVTTGGQAILPGSVAGHELTVEAFPELLPIVAGTYESTVEIKKLYSDTGPLFSVADALHRSKTGSYLPTQVDPHGMGFGDFEQQVGNIPQPIVIGGGAAADDQHARLPRITTARSVVGGVTRTLLWIASGGTVHTRIYKNSSDHYEIITNAAWNGTDWTRDDSTKFSMRMRFTYAGIEYEAARGSLPAATFADATWQRQWATYNFTAPKDGAALQLGDDFQTGTGVEMPRIRVPTTGLTCVFEAPAASGSSVPARIYANGASGTVMFASNARWDTALVKYAQDDGTKKSVAIVLDANSGTFTGLEKAAGAAAWTSWDVIPFLIDMATGALTLANGPASGGVKYSIDTRGADKRYLLEDIANSDGTHTRRYAYYTGSSPYAFTETTINAKWTGDPTSQWSHDYAGFGSATVYRQGVTGMTVLRRTGVGAWNDAGDPIVAGDGSTNLGGFTSVSFDLRTAGHSLPAGLWLPALSGSPSVGTLYADNIPKAWAVLQCNSGADPTILEEFNFTFVSYTAASCRLLLQFKRNMASANYFVDARLMNIQTGAAGTGTTPNPWQVMAAPSSAAVVELSVAWWDPGGPNVWHLEDISAVGAGSNGKKIGVVVYGKQ